MPLMGSAAMALFFDIAPEARTEHDHWHTHEHFAERLGIPGFLRASRWTASTGSPDYFVMYEVAEVATLESAAYHQRLDNPTPWTTRMMPHYRGMTRGFCSVVASAGALFAATALVLRFSIDPARDAACRGWLAGELVPHLAAQPGLAGAHLLESAAQPAMTREQTLRGRDSGVDRVLLVSAYDADALAQLATGSLRDAALAERGVGPGATRSSFRLAVSATPREMAARPDVP